MSSSYKHNHKTKLRQKSYKFAVGLTLGFFKTLTLYFLLRYQFEVSFYTTFIIVAIVGTLFTIISCCSSGFQCTTLLMVPQVLSKRGRAAVIAYVVVLALNGPARNAIANIEILGQALGCSQDQLNEAIYDALQAVKIPFLALKKAIGTIMDEVAEAFVKVQRVLMRILEVVRNILQTIKAGHEWLSDVISVCNKKSGTPFERCHRALESAIEDCKRKLTVMGFMCKVTNAAKLVCYSVKVWDYFCELIDFSEISIVETIEKELQKFIHNIEVMFKVTIDFDHAYDYNLNTSKTFTEIAGEIKEEVHRRSQKSFNFFSIFGFISSFYFIYVAIRSIRYKMQYLTKDAYDNFYISGDFQAIDARRRSMHRDTVLPLTRRERNRYISLTSISLIRKEKLRIAHSAVFLFVSSVQILGLISADYALYWLLATIRYAMLRQEDIQRPPMVTLEVRGVGIVADMYRGIVGAFEPVVKHVGSLNPERCAPNPHDPNYVRYLQICLLLLFCWICIVLEPYGLRVRQIIMRGYYPKRAKERAAWLYSDILLKRETFVKIARRQLAFGKGESRQDAGGFMDVIRAKTDRFWICRKIFGARKGKRCILCGARLADKDVVECLRPGCVGRYCYECFVEIQHVCSICSEAMDLSGESDVSIERDSSDEEMIPD